MTPPMTPREKVEPSLDDLLKQASEMMAKWTPEERAAHFEAQKKAIVAAEMAFGDEGTRTITALASGSGDHAELAAKAERCTTGDPWYTDDDLRGRQSFGQFLPQDRAFIAAANPATVLALLAENAALRERLETARIARAAHNRQHGEAERKLAEAEGVLRDIAKGEAPPEQHGHYLAHRKAVDAARTFLSKEAERG